ncbi:MAG TPA: DUF6088 family protein [Pedobacter sp.]|jgi:hypothetical protein
MSSTHNLIIEKIKKRSGGSIFFPNDFRGLGSDDAIKMSLSRHAENGRLERIAHGIYYKPHKYSKDRSPSLESIAVAIAKKERILIKPSGLNALYKLSMVSTAPVDLVYITDGEPRNILVDGKRLIFKSTTPKKLNLSTETSGLLIQALEEIGRNAVDDSVVTKVKVHLKKIDQHTLDADLKLAPAWIYNLIYKLNEQIKLSL